MKKRLLSALVGLPLLGLAVWFGVGTTGVVTLLASAAAGLEIARIGSPRIGRTNLFTMALAPAVAGTGLALALGTGSWPLTYATIAACFLPGLILEFVRSDRGPAAFPALFFAGLYGILLAHAPLLRSLDNHGQWLFLAMLSTFSVDTGAYFVGRTLGRRKLAPRLSPGKTVEGTVGGVVCGIAVTIGLVEVFHLSLGLPAAAALGAAISCAAVCGDLLESALKRLARVKDAGTFIPGHGGMLDRIDSLSVNLAVVYWFAIWLSR